MLLTTKAENVLFILPCQKKNKQKQNLPAAQSCRGFGRILKQRKT